MDEQEIPQKRPTSSEEIGSMARKRRSGKKKNQANDAGAQESPPSATPDEERGTRAHDKPPQNTVEFPKRFARMRLEAIFYPKFENEQQENQRIRQLMKERTDAGEGYLEVSVKHSGSLILWSGGERFYSKNSTCNSFTAAAQILIRQHFTRAFWKEQTGEEMFQACSEKLEHRRLTLAFEVVTSFLGDHGDRPKRDFLILTAVAVRSATPRFLKTIEIVDLAHQYRLPHNDAWVFSSKRAVESLFDLYDNSREDGVASTIIPALSEAADVHVSSLYPHEYFQGDIMEGIVIRYVPCKDEFISNALQRMKELSKVSKNILEEIVPPTLESTPLLLAMQQQLQQQQSSIGSTTVPILTSDLRQLYLESKETKSLSFDEQLTTLLDASGSSRGSVRPDKSASTEIPMIAESLRDSSDLETRRIARLIQVLESMNDKVQYVLMQEKLRDRARWLCIIHVLFDQTFPKYRKRKEHPSDLELYRGFCIELLEDDDCSNRNDENTSSDRETVVTAPSLEQDGEPLMLKMKLLPYMVRTFCCRNGLVKVKHGGASEFSKYCRSQLAKWGMSEAAKRKWQPFFDAWGSYADTMMNKGGKLQIQSSLSNMEAPREPLGSQNYLDHVLYFNELFQNGAFSTHQRAASGSSCLQGLFIVVGEDDTQATEVADHIAHLCGGAHRLRDIKKLDKMFMENACLHGEGHVLSVSLMANDTGPGPVRKLLKSFKDQMALLLFDVVGNEEIAKEGKTRGILNSWKSTRVSEVYTFERHSFYTDDGSIAPSHEFQAMINKTCLVAPRKEERPGLLVFFPQIPGCGKSCLVDEEERMRQIVQDNDEKQRNLLVLAGDKIKEKYWPLVKQKRQKDKSSVVIADKNVPALTWGHVAGICANTHAFAIPVIPDETALQTTEVVGVIHLDGRDGGEKKHVYPFSLPYLAVCLARVLDRPKGSHPGKLDCGAPRAAMILLMFFGLYRRVSAELFWHEMEFRFGQEGAILSSTPIQIPFFKLNALPIGLPVDLQDVLLEGIKTQFGCDLSKIDSAKSRDHQLDDLEDRIRKCIAKHRDFLFSLTIEETVSKERFFLQLKETLAACNEETSYDNKRKFIKLVAINVPPESIHKVLSTVRDEDELHSFFNFVLEGRGFEEVFTVGSTSKDRRVIPKPHVTLAHFSDFSQAELHSKFDNLNGIGVDLTVRSLIWSSTNAALSVEMGKRSLCGKEIPASKNSFVHITIWVQDGGSAFKSNNLPGQVKMGSAKQHDFKQEFHIEGRLSLWDS